MAPLSARLAETLPTVCESCVFALDFDYFLEPNRPHRKRRAPRGGSESSPDPPWLALSVTRARIGRAVRGKPAQL